VVVEDLRVNISLDDIKELYSSLDDDNDGSVDFVEFQSAISALGIGQ